jgi:hypothetical protein
MMGDYDAMGHSGKLSLLQHHRRPNGKASLLDRHRVYDVESELAAMKAEHDPLASHIFVSRSYYRNVNDTKSGKRREMIAR